MCGTREAFLKQDDYSETDKLLLFSSPILCLDYMLRNRVFKVVLSLAGETCNSIDMHAIRAA